MLIEFARAQSGGSTVATIHRRDGVIVQLHGYDQKFRVPHDIAHAVAERELDLADGVFGSIAGGALFAGMTVLAGKSRHDAAARSKRLLSRNSRALTRAEVMAGVVHDAVEHRGEIDAVAKGRVDWGIVHPEPFPWPPEQIERTVSMLEALATEWHRTHTLRLIWPDRLTSVMPESAGIRRGRAGRR